MPENIFVHYSFFLVDLSLARLIRNTVRVKTFSEKSICDDPI